MPQYTILNKRECDVLNVVVQSDLASCEMETRVNESLLRVQTYKIKGSKYIYIYISTHNKLISKVYL